MHCAWEQFSRLPLYSHGPRSFASGPDDLIRTSPSGFEVCACARVCAMQDRSPETHRLVCTWKPGEGAALEPFFRQSHFQQTPCRQGNYSRVTRLVQLGTQRSLGSSWALRTTACFLWSKAPASPQCNRGDWPCTDISPGSLLGGDARRGLSNGRSLSPCCCIPVVSGELEALPASLKLGFCLVSGSARLLKIQAYFWQKCFLCLCVPSAALLLPPPPQLPEPCFPARRSAVHRDAEPSAPRCGRGRPRSWAAWGTDLPEDELRSGGCSQSGTESSVALSPVRVLDKAPDSHESRAQTGDRFRRPKLQGASESRSQFYTSDPAMPHTRGRKENSGPRNSSLASR